MGVPELRTGPLHVPDDGQPRRKAGEAHRHLERAR